MEQENLRKAAINTQKYMKIPKEKTTERENSLSDGDYRCILSRARVSEIEPFLCGKGFLFIQVIYIGSGYKV